MGRSNFYTPRSTPSPIQPYSSFPNGSVNVQQDECISRPNVTGFYGTRSDSTDSQQNVSQPMLAGDQQYVHPASYAQTAPVLASVPTTIADDWGFRPDPNIEGHWIAVLESREPPPTQHQNAQIGYPVQYFENESQYQYQMHPYATSLSAYSSPLEPYLTPHSQSSSSDMSSPYMVAPYTAEACWHSTPQQGHPVMESPLSSPEYTTARPSPVSPEQAADGMYIPRHRHEGKISLKVNARGQQSALFQCGICQEKFAKKSNRDEHERTHDHDKPRVPCTEFGCYKDFGRPADLARHKRSHHRNDRHVCRYCGKGYNRSDILKRHERQSCRKRRADVQAESRRHAAVRRRAARL